VNRWIFGAGGHGFDARWMFFGANDVATADENRFPHSTAIRLMIGA